MEIIDYNKHNDEGVFFICFPFFKEQALVRNSQNFQWFQNLKIHVLELSNHSYFGQTHIEGLLYNINHRNLMRKQYIAIN